jgi:hypothetical protein
MVTTMAATRPTSAGTHPSEEQQQQQQDVELGFDGDRPERPVGAARREGVLQSKPYTATDFSLGTAQPGLASTYQVTSRLNTSSAQ